VTVVGVFVPFSCAASIEGVDSPVLTAQQLVPCTFSANATAQTERFVKSANYGGAVEVVYTVEVDKKKGMRLKHLWYWLQENLKTKHQFQKL
jgi:hypothetical protein